ncbi:MAG: nucleoside deaminase [bacterium]
MRTLIDPDVNVLQLEKNMTDEKFMQLAIEKAREGLKSGQTPFGACIVKNNEVIACVHNEVWQSTDITAHAEVHAIRAACKKLNTVDLSGSTIYSTCEPCPMCFSACHWARISKIVFGARIEDAESAGFNELAISNQMMKQTGGSPVEIVGDFLRPENQALFREWINSEKKRVY